MNKNHSQSVSWLGLSICILGAIFYCYEYYLRVAPSVMSAELKIAYQISEAGLGFLSACFYYAYMPLQIPIGMLMDKFGPRRILTLACMLCVLGTLGFAVPGCLHIAQLGRFLVGFGSAFAFVGVLKITTNWLPEKLYATMVGLCMLLGMLGAMGGEIIMAYGIQTIGWVTTLRYSGYIGLVLALILWLIIRDHPKIEYTSTSTSFRELPLLASLARVIKHKQFWLAGFIGCFTFMPLSSFAEMWAVSFLEAIGYHKEQAAFGSSMVFLGFGLGSPLWGIFSDLIRSRKKPLVIGALLATLAASCAIFFPSIPCGWMYISLFLVGFFTSAEILVFAIGNDTCAPEISGTTISFINMTVMLGGVILQPVIGWILDYLHQNSHGLSPTQHYQLALSILPIGLFFAAFLSTQLKESYRLRTTLRS